MEPTLQTKELFKRFVQTAVDHLSLTIAPGELYALLGPNGADKTTTLRMVAGLLTPDRGSIRVFDVDALADPHAAKRLIAWLPDEPMLYDKLTPLEYLECVAGLWSVDAETAIRRAEELLRCAPVSDGAIRRAKLAAALLPVAVSTSPVLALLWFRRWPAFAGILGICASSLSKGLIQLWYQKAAPRGAFRRLARQSYAAGHLRWDAGEFGLG